MNRIHQTSARSARTPTLAQLEQRVSNQQARINQGLKAGTLSPEEAKKLQGRLDQVKSNFENDAFDGNGLSRGNKYAKQLNGLSHDIAGQKHDQTIDPAKRMDNIDQRIAAGQKDGSLTTAEGKTLADKAAVLRAKLTAATTPEQKAALGKELQSLSREVAKERHDGELDSTKRQANFEERIAAGVADGSLTQKEADQLRARAKNVQLTGSSDAKKNNALNSAIYRARHDGQMNVPTALTSLGSKVDSLAAAGKLTPEQASAFKAQLQQLSQPGAQAVGPRLNALRTRLEGLN